MRNWGDSEEKIIKVIDTALTVFVIITIVMLIVASAQREVYGAELIEIESTAYYEGTVCADGTEPVVNLTLAGRKEWIGKTAALYISKDGLISEFIGYYEFHDTGGDERLKNGTCIDIFMQDRDTCLQWGRRNVFMMILDAEG